MSNFFNFIRNPFSLNTTIDIEEEIPFLPKDGTELNHVRGLAFVDNEGIKASKRAGWIMSLKHFRKYYDDENYCMAIQSSEVLEQTLRRFAVGILSCHHKRTGEAPQEFYNLSEQEKFDTGKELLSQSFANIKDKDRIRTVFTHFENTGFVVCDLRRNIVAAHDITTKHNLAIGMIKKLASETEIVIPVIITSLLMNTLTRKHNLLEDGRVQEHETITFEPRIASSTKIDSQLGNNISQVFDELSSLSLDQSIISSHLDAYRELTLESWPDIKDLDEIRANINKTIAQTKELYGHTNTLREDYLEVTRLANAAMSERAQEVEKLQQRLHNQQQELVTYTSANTDLDAKITELEQDKVDNNELIEGLYAKLTSTKRAFQSHQRDNQYKTQLLEEYNNELKEVEKKLISSRQSKVEITKTLVSMKQEYDETANKLLEVTEERDSRQNLIRNLIKQNNEKKDELRVYENQIK